MQTQAQKVSFAEAENVARNFFGKAHKTLQTCADVSVTGEDTLYYVFNADKAFVVVSADKKSVPVLAYSTQNNYDANEVIPPVKMWMDFYRRQLWELRQDNTFESDKKTVASWEALQHFPKQHKNNPMLGTPLLQSKWGQGRLYNLYCPQDDNGTENKRAVTGCVATAMAQLMYYFRFPEEGTGNYTYLHDAYGELTADFSQAKYDYDAMSDKPTQINPAISLLMYHCGVAVDMVYGAESSGMYNHKAADALKTYFNFSPQTQYVFRDNISMDWDSLIVSYLDQKIPLYYAGWSVPDIEGHAFICDAYQTDTNGNYHYHFNFGWDGRYDGYFYTNTLSPGGNDFNLAQELILNAYPDTARNYPKPQPLTGISLLTKEAGSFTDGSEYGQNASADMDYQWHIRPDVDSIIRIDLDIRYQLAANDTLFITTNDENINHILTCDTASFSLKVASDAIFVRLKTVGQTSSSGGFSASYNTLFTASCKPLQRLTSTTGTLNDGSGNKRYTNFSDCKYLINVSNANTITCYFSEFETEKDKDILYIRDNTTSQLVAALSGTLDDTVFFFNSNHLFLEFVTDEQNIYGGWQFTYATDVPQTIEENDFVNGIPNIYPNPVTDRLSITISKPLSDGLVQITDICGKLLISELFYEEALSLDLGNLAQGIYIVKITDGRKRIKTAKIIKE
jgi:hypothetical protein